MLSRRAMLLASSLSLIWGSQFLFIAVALRTAGAIEIVFVQLVLATVFLFGVSAVKRSALPKDLALYKHTAVLGLIGQTVPFFLLAFAQQRISSGTAGVLVGTVPLAILALAALFLRSEPITRGRVLGLLLGFAGVALVVDPWTRGFDADLLGGLAALGTAFCFAAKYVYNARFVALKDVSPSLAMAMQTFFALLWMTPVLMIRNEYDFGSGSEAVWSQLVLGIVCTGFGHLLFFNLLSAAGAVGSSVVEYAATVIAVAIGVIVLNETVSLTMLFGVLLVLGGIALVDRRPRVIA